MGVLKGLTKFMVKLASSDIRCIARCILVIWLVSFRSTQRRIQLKKSIWKERFHDFYKHGVECVRIVYGGYQIVAAGNNSVSWSIIIVTAGNDSVWWSTMIAVADVR